MTKEEYEQFMAGLTPYEKRVIYLLQKMTDTLEEIAAVGRD